MIGELNGLSDEVIAAGQVRDHSATLPSATIQQTQALPAAASQPQHQQVVTAQAMDLDQLKSLLSSVVQESTRPQIEALDRRMTEMDRAMREGRQRHLQPYQSEGPHSGERPTTSDIQRTSRSEDPLSGKRLEPADPPRDQDRGKKRQRHVMPMLPLAPSGNWAPPQEDELSLAAGSDLDDMSTTVTRSPQDEFQESSSDDEDGPQRLQRAKDHQLPPQGEQKIVQVAGAKSEERAARDLSLRAIMTEHLPVESWGPALHDSLHEPLKQMWLAPLDKAVVAATAAKYEIPANAKYLRVQRTNTEVFGLANGPGKAQDAALQSRQDTLLKAATATSQALSGLMAIPKGEPLEDGALERIFQQLWDSMSLS